MAVEMNQELKIKSLSLMSLEFVFRKERRAGKAGRRFFQNQTPVRKERVSLAVPLFEIGLLTPGVQFSLRAKRLKSQEIPTWLRRSVALPMVVDGVVPIGKRSAFLAHRVPA
jgi:hypothetical protein